jgi:hypothetical protein
MLWTGKRPKRDIEPQRYRSRLVVTSWNSPGLKRIAIFDSKYLSVPILRRQRYPIADVQRVMLLERYAWTYLHVHDIDTGGATGVSGCAAGDKSTSYVPAYDFRDPRQTELFVIDKAVAWSRAVEQHVSGKPVRA